MASWFETRFALLTMRSNGGDVAGLLDEHAERSGVVHRSASPPHPEQPRSGVSKDEAMRPI
jgi:hypothetical protein